MKKKNLHVLVACEESQAVTKAFLDLNKSSLPFNIEAYSCDLLPSSGGFKDRHFNKDVFEIIEGRGGINECGENIKVPKWDLMIAHPPCTYLAVSGAKWYYHPDDKEKPLDKRREHPNFPGRRQKQREALDFFKQLFFSDIAFVAIENPVSVVSSKFQKPNDTVQPWQFGEHSLKRHVFGLEVQFVMDPGHRYQNCNRPISLARGSVSSSKVEKVNLNGILTLS